MNSIRCYGISCFHFYCFFLFRNNGMTEILNKNNFRHCYGNFFNSAVLKVTWSQLYSKFFLNRYIDHNIWETLNSWRFYENGSADMLILSWLNIMKQNLTGNLSVAQKSQYVLRRSTDQNRRWTFTCYCMFLFLSDKPRF